jgi:peptide/nickel transport system ATP-binding protein
VNPILLLDSFTVSVETDHGLNVLADAVDLEVARGETLVIVGESGSGKSVTMLSVARLLEHTAPMVLSGRALVDGTDIVTASRRDMNRIRARKIGVIFQEAMEALNPTRRIGDQLEEAYRAAQRGAVQRGRAMRIAAREKAIALLDEVGMTDPAGILLRYPHQLSGGMQQRVMIAMALMGDPDLLIADEPTTALDVTVQAEILRLLRRLQIEHGMACVLITHDMGIAAEIADRIAVFYAGQVVEVGDAAQMLGKPQHPYTKALLECVPRAGERLAGRMRTIPGSVPPPATSFVGDRFAPRNALATPIEREQTPPVTVSPDGRHMVRSWNPIAQWTPELIERLTGAPTPNGAGPATRPSSGPSLVLKNVSKTYAQSARGQAVGSGQGNTVRAVNNVSFEVRPGELLGIVGETGSGKSTLGRLMLDLERPDPGSRIELDGVAYEARKGRAAELALRQRVQAIFQDPQASIDPRQTIGDAIAEPMRELTSLSRREIDARVRWLLDAVGLPAASANKHAMQLSGGQRQRVAIARAIAPKPSLIVADEPTSALDVSVQGQIVNLLIDLQRELGLSYVFITHNLSLVTSIADRVAVMYRGDLVELADAEQIVRSPGHEYTARLLASNPDPFRERSFAATNPH